MLRCLIRPIYLAVVIVLAGFLLLATVGAIVEAVDATKASATVWNAFGAAAILVVLTLILDGPMLRRRLARQGARASDLRVMAAPSRPEPSRAANGPPRNDRDTPEPAQAVDDEANDPSSTDESAPTIRLRPLAS
jgi:hypothetical protein